VVTASLSGLTPYPDDPIYAMTKHAVVGLVRSLAPSLAKDDVTINCVCPGFVATPLIDDYRAKFEAAGLPLLSAEVVAEAVLAAADSGDSGQAWVCQPGRSAEPYRFRGVPGPTG
jgi:NAD(P)-dependent dehydrogenase (short-subunit alcohol dehydrogenase family)